MMDLPETLEINGIIYRKDKSAEAAFQSPTVRRQATERSPDSEARSLGDLVTPKQLGMIRYMATEAFVDQQEECQRVMKCKVEELSKRAASSFIDHLKELKDKAVA